jgi:hypothetical protein
MMELHKKISENKPSLAVHRQALKLWGLLRKHSRKYQTLRGDPSESRQKQNMRIVRSDDTIALPFHLWRLGKRSPSIRASYQNEQTNTLTD